MISHRSFENCKHQDVAVTSDRVVVLHRRLMSCLQFVAQIVY
jgi:hypothetical protein